MRLLGVFRRRWCRRVAICVVFVPVWIGYVLAAAAGFLPFLIQEAKDLWQ